MMVQNANAFLNTLDPRSMGDLKVLAKTEGNSDEALRAASKQVESLFLQMMLKSMRNAALANGPFDSEQTKLVQGLHDQQLASNLAQSKGIGLADVFFRQLGGGRNKEGESVDPQGGMNIPFRFIPKATVAESVAQSEKINETIDAARKADGQVPEHVRNFVVDIWPHAHAASLATGIPAHFMVAQAALETGWGAKQLKNADGSPSYNLFNIKAGSSWKGATTAQKNVDEFEGGSWQSQRAAFRSYGSWAEAFADYAKLLTDNPRYAKVLGRSDAAGFAQGLKNAGYATDPLYADKLMRIIGGNTLKNALVMMA
ncbi:MAG: flagellar assembly peptidoglycan hydrolase FlgJ [Betaproteobacteria bacterium]|nr:flagellar assembly peptidoglycan hydrolase FlgJ [Betaproteobacteria bacterium]